MASPSWFDTSHEGLFYVSGAGQEPTPMADTATAPAPQAETAQTAPILTSMDGLDAAMAAARAAATSADTTESTEDQTPPREPAQPSDTESAPVRSTSEDAPEDGEDEPVGDNADPNAQPKPSNRWTRIREQLTQAEQAKRDIENKLNERLGADLKVRQKYADLLGTPEEKSRLEAVLANQSSPDFEVRQARTRLAQMRQAGEELAPLYTAVQQDVFAAFVKGLEGLRTLDGMDEAAHQSLYKATSGVDALKLMHGIGEKAAEERIKGELASLKAQVSDLKTKLAARGSQPATGGGLAPGGSTQLAGLLGADGLPTEEAIARAKAGGLRQLGRVAAA